ncbi:hypothetical protein CMO92_04330 [Candidatus Woesearchaeota archaeon]|nr:hypothetical protein [Candidatus Woesearchaeota archaeon]|tara:strand:+ start:702 stop:1931 length:1230 start_codon:yes stop_codon:yes gene_type:complete
MPTKFSLDWERKFGWNSDPFVDHIPESVDPFLAGLDDAKQGLNLFILKEKQFGLIRGAKGSGKSILTKWFTLELKNFENRIETIHLDVPPVFSEQALCKQITEPLTSFTERKKKKDSPYTFEDVLHAIGKKTKTKRCIIIFDPLDNLTREALYVAVKLFALPNVQVVATCSKEFYSNLPKTVKDQDCLSLEIKSLTPTELKDLLQKRIAFFGGKSIEPFTEKELQSLHKKTIGNPRELLKEAKEIALKKSLSLEMPKNLPRHLKKESELLTLNVGSLTLKFLPNKEQQPLWVFGAESLPTEETAETKADGDLETEDIPSEEPKGKKLSALKNKLSAHVNKFHKGVKEALLPSELEDRPGEAELGVFKSSSYTDKSGSEMELNEQLIKDLARQSRLSEKDLKTMKSKRKK